MDAHPSGEITELRCTYDPATRGGKTPDGRKVRGTIQWVSAEHGVPCELRLYDRLFTVPQPDAPDQDFMDFLNPDSLVVEHGFIVLAWEDQEVVGMLCIELLSQRKHFLEVFGTSNGKLKHSSHP